MMLTALAAAAAISASCEWQAPRGLRRLVVPPASLVDSYTSVPPAVRAKLKARIAKLQYDDVATIKADSIKGAYAYGELRGMYFGTGQRCEVVTRKTWGPMDEERALMFSETADGVTYTMGLPTVCANLSLFTRIGPVSPPRLLPPPAKLPPDPQPAEVTPLPVRTVADFPPITVPGVPDVPTTFSAEGNPDPMPRDSYPEPVTARQEFFDPWSRPLFGPIARLFVPVATVPAAPIVSPPVGPMPPVPGVVPPTVPAPFPMLPVIGTAVMVPCSGVQLTLPATPAEIAALCPPTSPSGAPVDLPESAVGAVQPVPEPAEWVLMLGGLAMVARWVRRGNVLANLGPTR